VELDARARAELEMQRNATAEAAAASASLPKNPLAVNLRAPQPVKTTEPVIQAAAKERLTPAAFGTVIKPTAQASTAAAPLTLQQLFDEYETQQAAAWTAFKQKSGIK